MSARDLRRQAVGHVRAARAGWVAICLAQLVGCSEVTRWSEFHGDPGNDGYVGVSTPNAEVGTQEWIQPVGPVGFSSPAVAPDGTIYLANARGVLWGWYPDGNLRYKAEFPPFDMLSSVSVSSDGLIHFTYLRSISGNYFSSFCRVQPQQELKLLDCVSLPDSGITTAPPKLWEHEGATYAFVPSYHGADRDLLVFRNGQIIAKQRAACPVVVEGGKDDWWKTFVAILTGGLSVAIPQLNPFQFTVSGIDSPETHLDPAVGIYARSSEGRAILVVAFSGCPVQGFEWNARTNQLKSLWQESQTAATFYSSPAIFFNGMTSIGRDDGHVRSFNAQTGQVDWEFDAKEAVLATSAIGPGGDQYVVASKHVFRLSGGKAIQSFELPSDTESSPALSLDHLYVPYSTGMMTLDHSLVRSRVTDGRITGGLSSPAIGADGSVYVATLDGYLYAFKK